MGGSATRALLRHFGLCVVVAMTANALYSHVVAPPSASVDEDMSCLSSPPPPSQHGALAARFDSNVLPTAPCMSLPKLLSHSFDFRRQSELWPHQIHDMQLNLTGSSWERLLNPPVQPAVPQSSSPLSDEPSAACPKYPRLTIEELSLAKPHSNAFFCPIEWSWLVISQLGATQPPLPSLCTQVDYQLPSDDHQPKYHFFQHFEKAVDSVVGFRRQPVSMFDASGQVNLANVLNRHHYPPDSDHGQPKWDARICYNCKKGIIYTPLEASVPSVFRKNEAIQMITHARHYTHQDPATKPEQLVYKAWHTIFIVVQNAIVDGKMLPLPLDGKSISGRMPWDPISATIWSSLGVTRKEEETVENGTVVKRPLLVLPNLNVKSEQGRNNRAIWVRALLEVSVFLKHWKLSYPFVEESLKANYIVPISLAPALPIIANLLGGNPIPTIQVQSSWQDLSGRPVGYSTYAKLGVLPNVHDSVVVLAYRVQVRSFKHLRFEFFDALRDVQTLRQGSEEIDLYVGLESSNGVIGLTELKEAWKLICGDQQVLDLNREDFIAHEFNSKMEFMVNDPIKKTALRDALKLLVDANPDNALLRAILDSSNVSCEMASKPKEPMDINKAYATLGDVAPTTDDEFLWIAYVIGISDQPGQKDLLREAIEVIANHRNSQAIRNKLAMETNNSSSCTDVIPYSPPPASNEFPVGLNNIGNTCYLNSLLQYFFSVRELREVLLGFPDYEQDLDEELVVKEKKRVGGRIVSTPEILRSKQFVSQLQALFHEMIYTTQSAVTPERELAFLALVSSKDDSPSILPSNNQDSSTSTDATLVDERPGFVGPVYNPPPLSSPSHPSSTVLGKRKSESVASEDALQTGKPSMEGNSELPSEKTNDEFVKMSAGLTPNPNEDQEFEAVVIDLTGEASVPPPLPPRPNKSRSLAVTDRGSHMMFGRQNDVSECMDNCLFQIQAALDEGKLSSSRSLGQEGNIVKSLFYGKTRQSLTFESPDGKVSVKEEPFAYLLVDVAEEGRDIYDGLDRVFDESDVELESGKATRRVGLVDLPPILQIQLQRVQFDRRTHTVFKSNAYMKFSERLKMDRYLELDPSDLSAQQKRMETISRRKQIESLRGRARELTTHVGREKPPASTVLRDLTEMLSTNEVNSSVSRLEFFQESIGTSELDYLAEEAKAIDEEILSINQRVAQMKEEVEQMWSSTEESMTGTSETTDRMAVVDPTTGEEECEDVRKKKEYEYRLVSLFIHRGTASGGHYWAIQRQLPSKPDRWLKYNDSVVSEVDPKVEVFGGESERTKEWNDGNPYWLTYVKVGEEDRFEMLCRKNCLPSLVSLPS